MSRVEEVASELLRAAFLVFYMPFRVKKTFHLPHAHLGQNIDLGFVRDSSGLGFELYSGSTVVGTYYLESLSRTMGNVNACLKELSQIDGRVLPAPLSIIIVRKSRFNSSTVEVYRRSIGCRYSNKFRGVKLISLKRDAYGLLMAYQRRGESYLYLDTIFGSVELPLRNKPRKIVYSNASLAVYHREYVRIVTPHSNLELPVKDGGSYNIVGVDAAGRTYIETGDVIYSVEPSGIVEPIYTCKRVVSFVSRDGFIIPYCIDTNEVIGSYSYSQGVVRSTYKYVLSKKAKCYVLLPYVICIDFNAGLVGVLEVVGWVHGDIVYASIGKGYSVYLRDVAPQQFKLLVLDELSRLFSEQNVLTVYMDEIVGSRAAYFVLNNEFFREVLIAYVETCLTPSKHSFKLCSGDGKCIEPLKVLMVDDCLYRLVFGIHLQDLRSNSNLTLCVEDCNRHIFRVDPDRRRIVVRYNVNTVKPISNTEVMIEISFRGSGVFSRVSSTSRHCRVVYYDETSQTVRLYCSTIIPSGYIILGGMHDFNIAVSMRDILESLSDIQRAIGDYADYLEVEDVMLGETFDIVAFKPRGSSRIMFSFEDGLYEVVEGHLAIRLPWSRNSLSLCKPLRTCRRIEFYEPQPPRLQFLGLVDNYRVLLGCSGVCMILCRSNVKVCKEYCEIPLDRVLAEKCTIIASSPRGRVALTSKDLLAVILRNTALTAHQLAKLLKDKLSNLAHIRQLYN